jgi:predicted nucleic-acid-binding protein
MIFIDTNYFIRFLVQDVESQSLEVEKIFEEGSVGKSDLFSSTIVFFEIYWLFKSLFKKPQVEIYAILKGVLQMKFIYFNESKILESALEIYKNSNLGLEDSYNLVYAKQNEALGFKTFDKELQTKWKTLK